jgi:Lon protease-like protein
MNHHRRPAFALRYVHLVTGPLAAGLLVAGLLLAGVLVEASGLVRAQVAPPTEAGASLPSTIPIFPLPEPTLFPHASRPLLIYEPRYRTMIADALKGDRIIGMVHLKPGFEADYEGRPPIAVVGCAGRIEMAEQMPDGRYTIILRGLTKFRVVSEDASRAYRLARVEAIGETAVPADARPALAFERGRLVDLLALKGVEIDPSFDDENAVDTIAQYLEMDPSERQSLLEIDGTLARAKALVARLDRR